MYPTFLLTLANINLGLALFRPQISFLILLSFPLVGNARNIQSSHLLRWGVEPVLDAEDREAPLAILEATAGHFALSFDPKDPPPIDAAVVGVVVTWTTAPELAHRTRECTPRVQTVVGRDTAAVVDVLRCHLERVRADVEKEAAFMERWRGHDDTCDGDNADSREFPWGDMIQPGLHGGADTGR